ncbi:MAG: iron ABC transporter permease [Flavobacteriales bacterium]|nr:iron ABC transporter permease [Flavobacteriales bacterium]
MSGIKSTYLQQQKKYKRIILILYVLVPLFFLADLLIGSVTIPLSEVFSVLTGGESSRRAWDFIILETRLPQSITAVFAGAGLAVGGLLLQTYFRNPLAGPDVLGISSGSILGVAIVLMGADWMNIEFSFLSGNALLISSSFIGALLVMLIISLFAKTARNPVTVIIAGMMLAYLIGALVNLIQHMAAKEGLQQFVFWGMGSFSGTDLKQSFLFAGGIILTLVPVFLIAGKMNVWTLGETYARSMGVSPSGIRRSTIFTTGLLTAIVTAFCGPIAFIGIAVPHLVKRLISSGDHRILIPAVIAGGALLSLICSMLSRLPIFEQALPLNAVTSIIGAPVVILVILGKFKYKGGVE